MKETTNRRDFLRGAALAGVAAAAGRAMAGSPGRPAAAA
ncbi:MAG: twin-arginine translocation signal domain-containing protein, partial [Kiritimatiellae bacterium]|nr:twin-arginine translocation signal domain-containing protein [Kiritimatiellia bacterium]